MMMTWELTPIPDEDAFAAIKAGIDALPPGVKMNLNSGGCNFHFDCAPAPGSDALFFTYLPFFRRVLRARRDHSESRAGDQPPPAWAWPLIVAELKPARCGGPRPYSEQRCFWSRLLGGPSGTLNSHSLVLSSERIFRGKYRRQLYWNGRLP